MSGDEIAFCFRAKNKKLVRRTITNATLAGGVEVLLELPNGSRLFRFEREGDIVVLSSALLNEYLGENLGEDFTAKDFRTWGGTLLAAKELGRRGAAGSEAESMHALAAVMRRVGKDLGNTPAVARTSYVSPLVVDHYLSGKTLEDFRTTNGKRPRNLTADELALVRLLRAPVEP